MSGRATRRDTAQAAAAAKEDAAAPGARAPAEQPAAGAAACGSTSTARLTPAAALSALASAHKTCAALAAKAQKRVEASAAARATARDKLLAVSRRLGAEPLEEDLHRAIRRRRTLDTAQEEHAQALQDAHHLAYYTVRPVPPVLPTLQFATCAACLNEVADAASVLCVTGGHHNCVGCISKQLRSAAASQHDLSRGADVRCFSGCGGVLNATTVVRALVAHGDADAIAHAMQLAARAGRLAGRIDTVGEQAAREAMTLPQRVRDLLQGLRCPACALLYDFTTAGGSCMHASCSACGTAFCGFCFRTSCRAEQCPLNPQPGSSSCGNKPAAVVYCHAFQLAQLLRASGATAAERKAALGAVASALAAASRPAAALLDPSSLTLVREARGVNYATLLVNNALQAAYGGISGADVPPMVFSAVKRDDCVRLIDDVALMREAFAAEGIDWKTHAAALTANAGGVWRVKAVRRSSLELCPLGRAAEGHSSPTVPLFAVAKHVAAPALVAHLAAAAVDTASIDLEAGDVVFIGHDLDPLAVMCAQESPRGGWHPQMAVLARGWALMHKAYPRARDGRPRGLAQVVSFGAGAANAAPGHVWELPQPALTRAVPAGQLEHAFAACCA